jgi:hypothetical protein
VIKYYNIHGRTFGIQRTWQCPIECLCVFLLKLVEYKEDRRKKIEWPLPTTTLVVLLLFMCALSDKNQINCMQM